MGGKLSDEDKKTIEDAVDAAISWMDSNKDASVDELKERKKDLEGKVQPIVSKLYAGQPPPTPEEGGPTAGGGEEKDEL
jgi:hypothetical protein